MNVKSSRYVERRTPEKSSNGFVNYSSTSEDSGGSAKGHGLEVERGKELANKTLDAVSKNISRTGSFAKRGHSVASQL